MLLLEASCKAGHPSCKKIWEEEFLQLAGYVYAMIDEEQTLDCCDKCQCYAVPASIIVVNQVYAMINEEQTLECCDECQCCAVSASIIVVKKSDFLFFRRRIPWHGIRPDPVIIENFE